MAKKKEKENPNAAEKFHGQPEAVEKLGSAKAFREELKRKREKS